MKKHFFSILSFSLLLLLILSFTACNTGSEGPEKPQGTTANAESSEEAATPSPEEITTELVLPRVWETAIYLEDTALGFGGTEITFKVIAEGYEVVFTLRTDEDLLENVLTANKLVKGDVSDYGLYVTEVNGIFAEYNESGAYWSLSKNGTPLMTGVSQTFIKDGEQYEFTYTSAH